MYLCDGCYSNVDFVNCECMILAALDFSIEEPTIVEFLHHFMPACQAPARNKLDFGMRGAQLDSFHCLCNGLTSDDQRHDILALRLAELALLDIDVMSGFPPSHIAAAALLSSNRLLGWDLPWPTALVTLSGYDEDMLEACASRLHRLVSPGDLCSAKKTRCIR